MNSIMSTVAQSVISSTRTLDPAGEPAEAARAFAHDPAQFVALYRAMALTRSFDADAVGPQRAGRLGAYASPLGQEAVAVWLAAAMPASDVPVPSPVNGGTVAAGARIADAAVLQRGDLGLEFAARLAAPGAHTELFRRYSKRTKVSDACLANQ
jgi:hypothetical protein